MLRLGFLFPKMLHGSKKISVQPLVNIKWDGGEDLFTELRSKDLSCIQLFTDTQYESLSWLEKSNNIQILAC